MHARQIGPLNLGAKPYVRKKSQIVFVGAGYRVLLAATDSNQRPVTAAEPRMMEKLIIDTLVLNARDYKIDGFRFDIMSFMFTYSMQQIQEALNAPTLEKAAIDGSKIYLY